MAHGNYHQLMSLDLDGRLKPAEQADLRQHLRGCAACAVAYERMTLIHRTLTVQPEVEPRRNFTARVMARVTAYEARRMWTPWFLVVLSGILLAAAVSVVVPPLVIVLGLYKPVLEMPAVASTLSTLGEILSISGGMLEIAGRNGLLWLDYLTTNPFTLGTVITALSLAAIWIGMRESGKYLRETETAAQTA